MKRSSDRILTTHVGSLARPPEVLELMAARSKGEPYDAAEFERRVTRAVNASVKKQVECGIDIVADGEQSKDSFYAYVRSRLAGFEPVERGPLSSRPWPKEIRTFQDYYDNYYFAGRAGGRVGADLTLVCRGPVSYVGQAELQADIARVKAAAAAAGATEVFMPSTAPQGLGRNEYYKTEEEFMFALADAMHEEYKAIVDAGLVVQVDDPALTSFFAREDTTLEQQHAYAGTYVEAINQALKGIPSDMVRFHTCYGINEGPRIFDVPLREIIGLMLKINADALSFEFGNPQHEHEYHVFEDVKLAPGKVLIPGIISHTTNVVEHREVVAERILNFVKLVGPEAVIAGADCGFSSQATYKPDIHPDIVWTKFRSLSEGAEIASKKLRK